MNTKSDVSDRNKEEMKRREYKDKSETERTAEEMKNTDQWTFLMMKSNWDEDREERTWRRRRKTKTSQEKERKPTWY